MKDAFEALVIIAAVVLVLGFIGAWLTVLPTVGLLWCLGALS